MGEAGEKKMLRGKEGPDHTVKEALIQFLGKGAEKLK